MLKIDTDTELTYEDFVKHKGLFPFKKWRGTSKTINFSLIFGASAMSFANTLEVAAGYPEDEAEEYIMNQPNGKEMLQATISKNIGKFSIKQCKYLVAATYMRNSFFETYKGLASRIEREQSFAKTHGYVRTHHGPVRQLPELNYMKTDRNGSLTGADKELHSKLYAHLLNEACNSTVQSLEARVAFATWYNGARYLEAWGLRSRIWNNIHDSLDYWVYKPELQLVMALANETASWEREPVMGIHMSFDGEVSDVQDLDHRVNTYWKHGVGVKIYSIGDAIKNWNKLNPDHELVYIGCDWWYDRFDENRPQLYKKYCDIYSKEKVDAMIDKLGGVKYSEGLHDEKGSSYEEPAVRRRRIIAE